MNKVKPTTTKTKSKPVQPKNLFPSLTTQNILIDDFWKDCISEPFQLKSTNPLNKRYNSKQTNLTTRKPKSQSKQKKPIKSATSQKLLYNFYIKHPEIYKEVQVKEMEKLKRKCAEERCLNMYAYAIQQQEYQQNLRNEHKLKQIEDELQECTWKPKLNKRTKAQEKKINQIGTSVYDRDQNRSKKNKQKHLKQLTVNNSYDDILETSDMNKFRFRPRVNSNPNLEKMFKNSFLTKRENAEFVMRYYKAREESLSKRVYTKENSCGNMSLPSWRKPKKNLNNSFRDNHNYKASLHKSLYSFDFDYDSN